MMNDPIMRAYDSLRDLEGKLEKVVAQIAIETTAHSMDTKDLENDKSYQYYTTEMEVAKDRKSKAISIAEEAYERAVKAAEATYGRLENEANEKYDSRMSFLEKGIEQLKKRQSEAVPKSKKYRCLVASRDTLQSEVIAMRKNIQEAQVADDARRVERIKREAAEREYQEAREAEMARQHALQVLEQQKAARDAADMERWKKQWAEEAKGVGVASPPPSPPAQNEIVTPVRKNRFMEMTFEEYDAIDVTTLPNEEDVDDYGNAFDEKFCAIARERAEKKAAPSAPSKPLRMGKKVVVPRKDTIMVGCA